MQRIIPILRIFDVDKARELQLEVTDPFNNRLSFNERIEP